MQHLIDMMIEEIEGAEAYCNLACDGNYSSEAKRMYKEIGMQELGHFEKLSSLYQNKKNEMSSTISIMSADKKMTTDDAWFKYFKKKADTLKAKFSEM